jgi:hypothetical protein
MVARLSKDEQTAYCDLPIITPEQRQAVPDALEAVRHSLIGSTLEQVEAVLGTISIALPKRQNEIEAEAMVKIYAAALDDIPPDILQDAGIDAIKTLSFFPKVAELRKLASPELYRRKAMLHRIEQLAHKFDHEYRPPIDDPVRPEDFAKLRKRLEGRFPSRRKAMV